MLFLIIGNCISAIAAAFTCMASWTKSMQRTYYYQCGQCLFLALASVFFGSYAGISTLLLCATRNVLVAHGKFTKTLCIIFLILTLGIGIAVNNNGIIGWIAIIATLVYTIGSYLFKTEAGIKWNIIVNLLLWMIYEVLVHDLSSFITDFVAITVAVIALAKLYKSKTT